MDTGRLPKPYELSFEQRKGYLYAFVSGEHDNFDISFAYWGEIGARLAELGLKKVLIVEDIPEQATMHEVYEMVTRLWELGFGSVKIAFVDRFLSHHDLNDFGALVGTNRGLNGRAFHTEAEAEAWLMDDRPEEKAN